MTPAQTWHLLEGDEGAEPAGEDQVHREAAADPLGRTRGQAPGWLTPTKETSLISWTTSSAGEPEIAVLNLRGRLENSGLPM